MYEALRKGWIEGCPHREGTASLRYHGVLHGLSQLALTFAPRPVPSRDPVEPPPSDGEIVRLVANLVLSLREEMAHVY